MDLPFRRLPDDSIDTADETFRVRRVHPATLFESIRRRGIRTPLLVEPAADRFRLVSGWGRWQARPRGEALPCFVLPNGLPLEEVWDIFLRDNEGWNVIEAARVLDRLGNVPGMTAGRIVTEKLPLLGLHASQDLYRRHLRLLELSPAVQRFIEEEKLPLRRAAVFLKLPAEAADLLLDAARDLHLTLNELGEALEMLEETAQRDRIPPAGLLVELRSGPAGRDKDLFRGKLRRRRYPELSRYGERLEALEKELRFTVPVRIEWDAKLERPGIRLAVELAEPEDLERFEQEIGANREKLRRFFEVL